MKKIKSSSSRIHTLDSFCHDSSSLWTKIALLTFYKVKHPEWIERLILIFEYLQVMSLALLSIYESPTTHNRYLFEIIIYTLKLINPSYLLSYDSGTMAPTVLIILFCCTLLKLLVFAKTVEVSIRNKEVNSWLLALWKWIYKLQTRVLYFLFTSFWVKTMIETRENSFSPLGMGNAAIIFVASLMIAIEFGFSLFLETQLCFFLPTKNFLSSKNYQLQMATFIQKFVIQMVSLRFKSSSEALYWIVPIIGFVGDGRRFYEFFFKLPLYHTKALVLQGSLLNVIFPLNLASFANIVLKVSNYGSASIKFVIIAWILLSLLTNKISYGVLKFQILSLLNTTRGSRKNAELLLHKITLTKELRTNVKVPTSESSKHAFRYLILMHHEKNLEKVFGLKDLRKYTLDEDGPSEETMNKIYLLYCQKLLKKYPKNSLVKLHTAYRTFKNKEAYAKVIKMVSEIQNNRWSKNNLGASLLLQDVENSILKNVQQQQKDEQNLNFSTYIKSMLLVESLKKDILEQTGLNLRVCNNMLNNSCDIEEIHRCAQRISKLKSFTRKKIDKLSVDLSEHFISPLLLFAEYHLVANHSKDSFEKYHEIYIQKYLRTQQFFQEPVLQEGNLYQDTNALIMLSTQKNEYGKILHCSNSLLEICGGQNLRLYEGSNITILFPSILKGYYENLFRVNEEGSMGKIHRAFICNKDRHLVEVDFCFKYHPYLTRGLCLSLIIRAVPVSENIDFLILSESGEVEGASRNLSKLLGLNKLPPSTIISIKDFSDELYLMNSAVNKVLKQKNSQDEEKSESSQKQMISRFLRAKSILQSSRFKSHLPSEMLDEKANKLYTAFTSKSQEISLGQEGEHSKFHSRVQVLDYGNVQLKLVTLNRRDSKNHKEVKIDSKTKDEDLGEFHRLALTEENLLNTRMETLPLTSERRNLRGVDAHQSPRATSRRLLTSPRQNHTPRVSLFGSNLEMTESTRIGHFEMSYIKRKGPKYTDTQSSMERRSVEKAENKIFRQAIVSKSYPKSFISLCFIFYAVILLTFAGQIIMKSVSDSTMQGLQIRKNLLKDSEEKTYKGVLLAINAMGVVLLIGNVIQSGGVFLPLTPGAPNIQLRMIDMKKANDQMLKYLYTLDRETHDKILVSNVRVDGTYLDSRDESYQYVDIFQITDEVLSAVRAIASLPNPGVLAGYHIANYLRINLVNDFLYQSTQVTNILTENVENQKEFLQDITNLFLILNPLLLTGIGILLCCIIWNQLRIEKENMKAFMKIPSEGVKRIRDRLSHFQRSLMNEENLEKKWFAKAREDLQSLYKRETGSAYSRKSETQQIQYEGLRKRYYKYIARVIVCISVLVVITIWDLVTTRHAIKVIYNQQSQLQFANYISNRAIVTHMTFVELFARNNTQLVEHEDAFDSLVNKARLLKEIQSEVPEKFLEVDGTYNPEVQEIIFVNDPECKVFNISFISYCLGLTAKGQQMNMIVAIASLQNLIEIKIQEFLRVDRSKMSNLNAAMSWTETPLTYSVVIAEEAHTIADIMDKSITEKVAEMKHLKTTIIIIFSMSLLVVSILVWLHILKVIREVHNDFKKVLQALPPNLVLSSYLLKRFLQRTSTGHLFFRKM